MVLFPGFTPVFPVSESAFGESPTTEMRERLGSSLTYEQQVGLSSRHVCLGGCVGGGGGGGGGGGSNYII